MNEVARLSGFDIRVAKAGEASYDQIAGYLREKTGNPASFPTLETRDGELVVGADNWIQLVAERHQASADAEISSYFNAYMAPATREILQSLRQANARIEELGQD